MLVKEQIFKSSHHFERENKKLQKLFPYVQMAENMVVLTFTSGLYTKGPVSLSILNLRFLQVPYSVYGTYKYLRLKMFSERGTCFVTWLLQNDHESSNHVMQKLHQWENLVDYFYLLSTPMGVDSLVADSDREVQPSVTYNV